MSARRPARRAVLGLAGLPLLAACGTPGRDPDPPEGAQRLEYGEGPSRFAELTRPAGAPRGTVVVLHGGFWLETYDLSLGRPLAEDLVARGFAALTVEYRRVGGGGGVPETLDDVSAAFDLLDGTDLLEGPVVALGHSAGGQLAAWAAGRDRLPRWSDARVLPTHVVAQAGVLDLVAAADEGLGAGAVSSFLGGTPEEVPEVYATADPSTQVPLPVPVWCVHGEGDDLVPIEQSVRYVDAVTVAGGEARLVEVEGGHLDLVDVDTPAWARTVEVLEAIAPAPS